MQVKPGFSWVSEDGSSSLKLLTLNPGGWPSIQVSFRLQTLAPADLTFPDGSTRHLDATTGTEVTWAGELARGGATIRIQTAATTAQTRLVAVAALTAAAVPEPATLACATAWSAQIGG